MKFNYNKQNITEQDISSVVKTLRSERITQGKKLQEFELLLKNTLNVSIVPLYLVVRQLSFF